MSRWMDCKSGRPNQGELGPGGAVEGTVMGGVLQRLGPVAAVGSRQGGTMARTARTEAKAKVSQDAAGPSAKQIGEAWGAKLGEDGTPPEEWLVKDPTKFKIPTGVPDADLRSKDLAANSSREPT